MPQEPTTTIGLPCKRCDTVITADDEDELVAEVQAHAAREHDLTHALSRERILAHRHDQDPQEE